MVFTGAILLLLVIWLLRPFAGPLLESSWQLQAASSPASASFNCSSGICPHSCDADVGWSHGALEAPLHVCSLQGRLAQCMRRSGVQQCRPPSKKGWLEVWLLQWQCKCKAAHHVLAHVCAGVAAFVVAFTAVIVGWALSLDYSAKLFTMTFVLVIMGSERASGLNRCTATAIHC